MSFDFKNGVTHANIQAYENLKVYKCFPCVK